MWENQQYYVVVLKDHKFTTAETGLGFIGILNIRLNFGESEFFGRRISTAGYGFKMAVSLTGPTARLGHAG